MSNKKSFNNKSTGEFSKHCEFDKIENEIRKNK